MVFRHFICFVFLTGLSCHFATAQNPRLDSLRAVAHQHPADTLGVLAYADLCYEFRFIRQDSAIKFGQAGVDLAQKIKYPKGLAQVSSDLGFIHFDKGDFHAAITLWKNALKLRTDLKDSARMASMQMKIGGAYFRLGDYRSSLECQLEALRLYEKLKYPQGMGQALNNVAAVYEHQNLLGKALEYYQRAYELHQQTKNFTEAGTSLINIGNIYFRKGEFILAKSTYNRALSLLPGQTQSTNHAICLNNLSEIHIIQNDYDSAKLFSERALKTRQAIGDYNGVISSLNMMGRIYIKLKNYGTAERYLHTALDSARNKNILPEVGKIQLNLSELYRERGDWKNSLESYIEYTTVKDSLLNQSGRAKISELQVQYETEKKEQQIALQHAALASQQRTNERNIIIFSGLVLTLILVIIILVLLRSRQKRKQEIERKENEIALRETYIKASIASQEDERKRFAQDLHDGMGQWISSLRLILGQIGSSSSDEQKLVLIEKSDKIMHDMNHEFRSIAFNLMPHTLINYGLHAALVEMVSRLNSSGKVIFNLSAFGFPERLPELAEVSAYRIIQEWTNNILKYSSARNVTIQLTGHPDEAIIMIEDDGMGFSPDVLQRGTGNGWKNIQSRANLIKGKVEVDSSVGRTGTTFIVTMPGTPRRPIANTERVVSTEQA
jgi:two-component system, NarL family, sensor kinase